eukprot:GEZU01021367.1.p1 GENE.GEZU01021367.1~~GEZU01021367.1.p1  ORF type:complete len:526 (+),score=230.69 GEZU01021367.1:92-1669(+)
MKLRIAGLLPPKVENLDEQVTRCVAQARAFQTPLEKYIYLSSLLQRNQTLFYAVLNKHLEEFMPIVYTPTVGEACQKFNFLFRGAQGMYFSIEDKCPIEQMLDNWPATPDIIVVTDGSRILGLGDLGANGMGIPIGKLSLYVAGAGFHPQRTLPVTLDVGTNNERLLADPLYLGIRRRRVRGEEFYQFADRFLTAVTKKWPNVLVQFEDFSNDVCFELLEKYRNRILCFNDDIQGTGAVILAGFINAVKVAGIPLKDHRLVFLGAGSAGIGVADQIVAWMVEEGLTLEEARSAFYFVDSKGLVTANRAKLEPHKVNFARKDITENLTTLLDVVKYVKPTGLIGLSSMGGAFTEEIIREVSKHAQRPIIFPLSNPTSQSECTAEQAYTFSEGRCVMASGSPFAPVEYNGKIYTPGQGNNMYIFPGLGLGAVICKATKVSDKMILAAAKALANYTTKEEMDAGLIYPKLSKIRDISVHIASAVCATAVSEGLARLEELPADGKWEDIVRDYMYEPKYLPLEQYMSSL